MKKGISLVSLAIVIVVMMILAGIVVINGFGSYEFANINTYALEMLNIQNAVNEYYYRYEKYPIKDEINFSLSTIDTKYLDQFKQETPTDNVVPFNVIDTSLLGITDLEYGKLDTSTDVYVLSESTGKVYYLSGVKYEEAMYYTLTDELYTLANIKGNEKTTYYDIKINDVLFVISETESTNQPITVQLKLPQGAIYNSVVVTNEKTVSSEVIENGYKVISINENGDNKEGNYDITVNYTYNGAVKTAEYKVTNYDNTAPTLSVTEEILDEIKTIQVVTQDLESGIKVIKYAETEIENASYFENYGKVLNATQLKLNKNSKYTIYVEDKAGNNNLIHTEEYAIYSATDDSLTFVSTAESIKDTYNNKEITQLYTGFEDDIYEEQSQVPWYSYRKSITNVSIEKAIQPISIAYWFYEFSNCPILDLTNLDTSKVTSMKYAFAYCGNVTTVFNIQGLNAWDTSKVTDMSYLFYNAGNVAEKFYIGNLSNWNTSQVTNMRDMFSSAGSAAQSFNIGNIGNWNVSKVTSMRYMFYSVESSVKEFYIGNLSKWDTSKVADMYAMFCHTGEQATEFDIGNLGNWNTSQVTDMAYMFYKAGNVAEKFYIGDLSEWKTSKVTNMGYMFYYTGANATWSLDCSKWTVTNVKSYADFNTGVSSKVTAPNFGSSS